MSGLLGVAYIIDHEVIPRPCKICDCLLNSSHDHFGLHQGHFQCDHGVRGLQKIFLRPTLPTDMVQQVLGWERQNRCSSRKNTRAYGREVLLQ